MAAAISGRPLLLQAGKLLYDDADDLAVTRRHQAPLEGTRDEEGAWPWENRGTLLAEGLTYSNKKLPMS
jgi:hypothetical protein